MSKTITLYLFKTNFSDPAFEETLFFCPYCMQVEGLLASFPVIRHHLKIEYVDFEKPRGDLSLYCGEKEQSCPQLVLPNGDDEFSAEFSVDGINGARRINKTISILDYLSLRFGLAKRH